MGQKQQVPEEARMPIGFGGPAFLPPYTIYPPQSPHGVLPAGTIGGKGIPDPYRYAGQEVKLHRPSIPGGYQTMPSVPIGAGYLSAITRKVEQMDVVRGFDRVMGKGTAISLGKKKLRWPGAGKLQTLTTPQALGEYTGRWPISPYGRAFDGMA